MTYPLILEIFSDEVITHTQAEEIATGYRLNLNNDRDVLSRRVLNELATSQIRRFEFDLKVNREHSQRPVYKRLCRNVERMSDAKNADGIRELVRVLTYISLLAASTQFGFSNGC